MKEREALLQMQLQPYLEKANQSFSNIAERVEYMQRCAREAPKLGDKKFFEIMAESYSVEQIARLHWYSDTEKLYENYKRSPLWKKIRHSVIQRDNYQCQGCGKRTYAGRKRVYDLYAFEVHHMDYKYETMAGLDDSGLVTLCRPCHKYIHYNNSEKRPASEWESALQRLKQRYKARKQEARKTVRLLNKLKKLIAKSDADGLGREEQQNKATLERELREIVSCRKTRAAEKPV